MVGQLRTLAARPEPVLGDSEPPVTPAPGDRQLLLVSPVPTYIWHTFTQMHLAPWESIYLQRHLHDNS